MVTAPADPALSPASKPAGISTAARIFLSEICCFQSSVAAVIRSFFDALSSPTTPGESAPPSTMMTGVSPRALSTTVVAILPTPKNSAGMTKVGMTMTEISVRRSRSESFSSLR